MLTKFILAIALFLGISYPYAGFIVGYISGTHPVTLSDGRGTSRTAIIGRDAPQPGWIPQLPGAKATGGSRLVATAGRSESGTIELLASGSSVDEIKGFYTRQLSARGFLVKDIGTAGLTPAGARSISLDSVLSAVRRQSGDELRINISGEKGWVLRARPVQLVWQQHRPIKMSQY